MIDQQMEYSYAAKDYNVNLENAGMVYSAYASVDRGRINGTNTSVRDSLTRGDYDFFRPSEALPREQKQIVVACDEVYQRIGLLKNIIDLMAEFGSQGIEIFHTSKVKQRRYRHWFRKVKGKERSERFLNLLYRHGAVVIKRAYADLNVGDIADLERGIAARTPGESEDIPYTRGPKVFHNRIPLQYTFLNPTAIDVIGGDLAVFAGDPKYALRIPEHLIRAIKKPKTAEDIRLVSLLPDYIIGPVLAGKKLVPLDMSKIAIYHYKKDDWQQWAYPMSYSILADLKLYEKNKLADMSALDGAISHIRLWRLGLPEFKIQPGAKAFQKLREELSMATGGGSMDLVWDKSLDLQETSTDVHKFLGIQKYEPILQAIYAGLGIPQSLTGSRGEGGMTNNALSLKTLIERLQYGRDLLTEFWTNELLILQEAFGDQQPAQLHFDNMSLSDEANEKMLWMHLADRDIVSVEMMREKFGAIPEVEEARIQREYAQRKSRSIPDKTGPFHDAQPDLAKQKIALQTGVVTPLQVYTPIDETKPDPVIPELTPTAGNPPKKPKGGVSGQGRPRNSNDKQKRKPKVVTPASASLLMKAQQWARATQKLISDTITPSYLERCNKKNMRGLTTAESDKFEDMKFRILCSIPPDETPTREDVLSRMDDLPVPPLLAEQAMISWLETLTTPPTMEEIREMHAIAYAILYTGENDGTTDDHS